jgi:hypothetical protein
MIFSAPAAYKCGQIAVITYKAVEAVKNTKNSKKKNAVRHFIWQAMLSYVVGPGVAEQVGNAHEFGQDIDPDLKVRADSAVDQHNNTVARKRAQNRPSPFNRPDPWAYLRSVGFALLGRGELQVAQ